MRRIEEVEPPAGLSWAAVIASLREAGAVFAYVHGSRADARHRQASDLDVAAWFGRRAQSWDVKLPPQVDLLVLDSAGLELAGRVAQRGILLFDDDPPTRVQWQADRCKRYLDEAHRRRELVATVFGDG
jgi:predicted nucleotidyltransferase